jgi:hypothetical protein
MHHADTKQRGQRSFSFVALKNQKQQIKRTNELASQNRDFESSGYVWCQVLVSLDSCRGPRECASCGRAGCRASVPGVSVLSQGLGSRGTGIQQWQWGGGNNLWRRGLGGTGRAGQEQRIC